jgi:hypothetical protein
MTAQMRSLATPCKTEWKDTAGQEKMEPPPFPLKSCISIAYKVKKLSCTVSVPFFRPSTDPLQTIS